MARVTPSQQTEVSDQWQDEVWYLMVLERVDGIDPKGSPGYKNAPLPYNRARLVWKRVGDPTEEWLWHRVNLAVGTMRDGTPSACKQLICALSGRNHLQESKPWVDDESLEYGFNADDPTDPPAGQIAAGINVAIRGKWGLKEDGNRKFSIEKYGPTSLAQPPPQTAATAPQTVLSPDGRFTLSQGQWVPVAAPETVPAPPAVPAPADDDPDLV